MNDSSGKDLQPILGSPEIFPETLLLTFNTWALDDLQRHSSRGQHQPQSSDSVKFRISQGNVKLRISLGNVRVRNVTPTCPSLKRQPHEPKELAHAGKEHRGKVSDVASLSQEYTHQGLRTKGAAAA